VPLPLAKSYLKAFDGRIYGPVELEGWAIGAWSGDHIGLRKDGFNDGPEINTHTRDPGIRVADLFRLFMPHVGQVVRAQQGLRFPLEVRFEQSSLRLRVDGRARSFKLITCGDLASASAVIGGNTVSVRGPRDALSEIALRRLTEKELSALLRQVRQRHGLLTNRERKWTETVYKNPQRKMAPAQIEHRRSQLVEAWAAKGHDLTELSRARIASGRDILFDSFTTVVKESDMIDPLGHEMLYVPDFAYLDLLFAAEELLKQATV
jgi:hypothetical protein